jgi:hypothetical protein
MHSRPNANTLLSTRLSFCKRNEPYLHSFVVRFSFVTCSLFSDTVPFTLLLLMFWFCVVFVVVLYRHNVFSVVSPGNVLTALSVLIVVTILTVGTLETEVTLLTNFSALSNICTGVPPYPQIIRSKTYHSYVKPRIIPNTIYNVIFM